MTSDAPFLREHIVDVDAAVIGISRRDWEDLTPEQADDSELSRNIMEKNRFDVMPIIAGDGETSEYVATTSWGDFSSVERCRISEEDLLSQRTPLDELVRMFAERGRRFFFLTRYGKVTGLVTAVHLNSRPSRVFFYSLIAELEMALARLLRQHVTEKRVSAAEILDTVRSKVREVYEADQSADTDADPTEYFYLTDLGRSIYKLGLHRGLGFTNRDSIEKPLSRLSDLRDRIAHPVRPLFTKEHSVKKLWRDVQLIDDLADRLSEAAPKKSNIQATPRV